ncbi:uncharacterized protein LOC129778740 isoform X2 [Toxorhynchites rutilus septentrionalis]|uniref:uncharacterized protein LOC129778740 isoform X2 n=1 Tax=Toxorhynchites rutilus septentrionalis TaxID=329112 RepID=UPI002478C3BC|nr:uncharacterized protein LOC129778740 isoform X2 [Toxorhynchites rutilus septentrionalis]
MEDNANVQQNIVIRRRSSLFCSGSGSASASPSTYKPSYENQLTKEIESWSRLLRNKIHEIHEHKQTILELDSSILSAEQQAYLNTGPSVESFVQSSNEFCHLLERYIQRKSFITQRYDAILREARAQVDTKAMELVEKSLLSKEIE